ncbi:MAG TPA: head GIN domain-containing protein [Prolixibacteraceae bacterium]|nr:head GIN domain-containing protein [Prolixibacteraceae bacterium]
MKKIVLLTVLTAFAFSIKAQTVTDNRKLSYFNEISLRVSADLQIEQGEDARISIETDEETLEKLIVEVVNNKLIIRFSIGDRLFSSFTAGDMKLKLIAPEIDMLSIQGSGSIIADKPISTKILDLNIAGSGDIKLADISCDRLEASINGSGDIVVSGQNKIKETEVSITGSGNYKGYQLVSDFGSVKIAGSGDCDVHVTERLEVRILGSGDVTYKGHAAVDASISGSGEIRESKALDNQF